MREGWTNTTLGSVASRVIGRTPQRREPRYWTEDLSLPFFTIADMRDRRATTGREGVTQEAVDAGQAKRVPVGSLLLSFKLTIGKVAITDRDVYPNEAIAWIRPGPGVERDFLTLALEYVHWDDLGGRAVKGKTMNSASLDAVPLALPPLDEQRRIVDLVGALDDTIAAAEASLSAAVDTTQARLRAIFSDPLETLPFADVATFASGAAFPTDAQGEAGGDIPFIKVSDMNLPGNETAIRVANNYVTHDTLLNLKARAWPAGTVVFPKVGAALLTEKRRILGIDTAFDNNVMGVIARDGVVTPAFLFGFMRTVRLGDYAQIGAVPSINQGHLRALSVPVLSLDRQVVLDSEVAALDEVTARCSAVVDRLRALRSNLLTALLSGEHEIPESYDEVMEAIA